jgi:hypothetical protein
LRRKCVLKYVIVGTIEDGRIDVTGTRGRRCKKLLGDLQKEKRVLEIERGSNRWHLVENWLCKEAVDLS